MDQVATIDFTDTASGDDVLLLVKASRGSIALGGSLRHDGDYEVVFPPDV
jgi:hypothetical protein